MRFSDNTWSLEISGCVFFGLLLFGFTLEGQSLLEFLRDVQGVEAPLSSDYRLEREGYSNIRLGFCFNVLRSKGEDALTRGQTQSGV